MIKHFFVNKHSGRRYEILGMVTIEGSPEHAYYVKLKGQYNDFIEPFDVAAFKKLGYILEKVEDGVS